MSKKDTKVEQASGRRKVAPTSTNNKRKHNKKVLRVLIYITLVVFVLSLLFLVGYGIYRLCTSPKYDLTTVTFEGNIKYSNEELIEATGIIDGTNLFRLSKNNLENNLYKLPYVKQVKISKKYPDTLLIKVIEYEADFFAYNAETDRYVKLTDDGIILEECEADLKGENELIIFGINFDDELGETIVEIEKTKLENYDNIKKQYDISEIDKEITSVEFKEGNIILTLDYDVNVIMNTNDLEYKLSFLKSILNEISGKAGTIDMTIENPIFRESIK